MEVWERTTGSQEWALNIEWGAGKVYVRASLTWSANELCSGRLKKWYCSRLKWRCEFYQGNHRVQEKAQINEWRDVTPLWKCLRLQYKPPSCPCVYQQWAMREESRMKKNKKSGHIDSDPGPAETLFLFPRGGGRRMGGSCEIFTNGPHRCLSPGKLMGQNQFWSGSTQTT